MTKNNKGNFPYDPKFADIWIKYVQFMIKCAEAWQRDKAHMPEPGDEEILEEMGQFLYDTNEESKENKESKEYEERYKKSQIAIRERLNSCGANIPDLDKYTIKIVIDTNYPSWPAVYIKSDNINRTKNGEIVLELSSGVKAPAVDLSKNDLEETPQLHRKSKELKSLLKLTQTDLGDINHESKFELKNSDVVIRIPFINPEEDLFYGVTFADVKDDPIVLSTCS